jgi:hypothetical protein
MQDMAKRKKKTLSQKTVATVTPGVPSPVRNVLTNRLVAPLIVLILGGLTATGVIQFNWLGGRPRVSIDEQRAHEVSEKVERAVGDVREDVQAKRRRSKMPPRLSNLAEEFGDRR